MIMPSSPLRRPYLLLFRESSPDLYEALSVGERQALMQKWNNWYQELFDSGRVSHGHPLDPDGRRVSGADGQRVVSFRSQEVELAVAGYFVVTVANLEEATEIAQQCPTLFLGMTVEVRGITECCHLARSLQASPAF